MADSARYPLTWPQGRPRKPEGFRKAGAFGTKRGTTGSVRSLTIAEAFDRLADEVARLGGTDWLMSSNLKRNKGDGRPTTDQAKPSDPGVCVYFNLGGKPHAMPCDTYFRVEDNMAAIAAHISATRAIERYGVADLAEMFRGFAALPSPSWKRPWREVFGFSPAEPVTVADMEARFRERARQFHSDGGGNDGKLMAELNVAHEEARAALAPPTITG